MFSFSTDVVVHSILLRWSRGTSPAGDWVLEYVHFGGNVVLSTCGAGTNYDTVRVHTKLLLCGWSKREIFLSSPNVRTAKFELIGSSTFVGVNLWCEFTDRRIISLALSRVEYCNLDRVFFKSRRMLLLSHNRR